VYEEVKKYIEEVYEWAIGEIKAGEILFGFEDKP
jgi:hypothetical protein